MLDASSSLDEISGHASVKVQQRYNTSVFSHVSAALLTEASFLRAKSSTTLHFTLFFTSVWAFPSNQLYSLAQPTSRVQQTQRDVKLDGDCDGSVMSQFPQKLNWPKLHRFKS